MTSAEAGIGAENPYPGLSPFDEEQAHLFFGRKDQIRELLARMEEHRFVGVVGLSGSGKSSLVRAGLIPTLRRGRLTVGGLLWRVATLRPGANPINQLANALNGALGTDSGRLGILERSSFGLIRASRAGRSADENLLVLIDQFEEVFRHPKQESAAFVRLMLTAIQEAQSDYRIYVVLTMRTDYIGDCAQFRDLPEALNDSQYLVPRMTTAQRREAIEEPAKASGGEIDGQLLQQLLLDAGDDPDQLPILQHLLMRMWDMRERSASGWKLTLEQYRKRGSWKGALNQHGKELRESLPDDRRPVAKRIFQRVTELGGAERDRRRLTRLGELTQVCSPADPKVVRDVIEHFRRPGADFLTSPDWKGNLDPLVDITHESLIRKWVELNSWAREEAEWGEWYRQVEQRTRTKGAYLAGGELALAVRAREQGKWNEAWASRYVIDKDGKKPTFHEVTKFLDESSKRRADELSRLRRGRARLTALAIAFGALALTAGYFARSARRAQEQAVKSAQEAEKQRNIAAGALTRLNSAVNRSGALLITTEAVLPVATVGSTYRDSFAARGGTPPYRWFVISGAVPAGLALDDATGTLSGMPTSPGAIVFRVQVSDAGGDSSALTFNLNVLPPSARPNTSACVDPDVPQKDAGPILTLRDPRNVTLVNMVPRGRSGETDQDSEPFLAVHPERQLMVGAAYTCQDQDTAPLYVSTDSGRTWRLQRLLPFPIGSQTYSFAGEGNRLLGAALKVKGRSASFPLSIFQSEDPSKGKPVKELFSSPGTVDEPFIQAAAIGATHIYIIGENNFGNSPHTASVTVSTDGGASFHEVVLESRSTGSAGQDSPAIRPSISRDGTVYVGFIGWRSVTKGSSPDLQIKGDVVLCRNDGGTQGQLTFSALIDPTDGKPGRVLLANRHFVFANRSKLGQNRIGGDLAVAADPNQSSTVYVAWADLVEATYTLHLRKSTDRGQTWTEDLLAATLATNPAIGIADDGHVGFLYQQLAGTNWETHFRLSASGGPPWSDTVLARVPSTAPVVVFQPYIGGHIYLTSVGGHFYGVFSASNDPKPEHFPHGVIFQRRHRIGTLLNIDGVTPVAISIDPYFFDIPSRSDSH